MVRFPHINLTHLWKKGRKVFENLIFSVKWEKIPQICLPESYCWFVLVSLSSKFALIVICWLHSWACVWKYNQLMADATKSSAASLTEMKISNRTLAIISLKELLCKKFIFHLKEPVTVSSFLFTSKMMCESQKNLAESSCLFLVPFLKYLE